jgi:hypothetical protein
VRNLFVLAALILGTSPMAMAGEGCGFRCDNACPLAQQANVLRARGSEALAASQLVRADWVARIAKNLDKI